MVASEINVSTGRQTASSTTAMPERSEQAGRRFFLWCRMVSLIFRKANTKNLVREIVAGRCETGEKSDFCKLLAENTACNKCTGRKTRETASETRALLFCTGGLQSRVKEEKFCHRDHRGHREPLVFSTQCPLCPLWLIILFVWFFDFAVLLRFRKAR